jgi:hypothetical protein
MLRSSCCHLTDDLAAASFLPVDVIAATIVAEAMLQRKASKSRGFGIRFRLLKKNPHLVSAVK